MFRYCVFLWYPQLRRETLRTCFSSFPGPSVSHLFAFFTQVRCSSGAGALSQNQCTSREEDTTSFRKTHSVKDMDDEWHRYFPMLQDFCERVVSTATKTFTTSENSDSFKSSSTLFTDTADSGIPGGRQPSSDGPEPGPFPLLLSVGNSPLPTSLQWILDEKYKKLVDSSVGALFELPTSGNPFSGVKPFKFLPLFVYLEPPEGFQLVSQNFAKAYMMASDWMVREQMWKKYSTQHGLQDGFRDNSKAEAAADGGRALSPPGPLFCWKLQVSGPLTCYATFIPSVPTAGKAALKDGGNDKEARQVRPTLNHAQLYWGSSYWVPKKLLSFLPFFPTPPSLRRAFQDSSLAQSGPRSHAEDPQPTEAAFTGAPPTAESSFADSALQHRRLKGLAKLWKGVHSPGSYLLKDYYFPSEAYPYLKFCKIINFRFDSRVASSRPHLASKPLSNANLSLWKDGQSLDNPKSTTAEGALNRESDDDAKLNRVPSFTADRISAAAAFPLLGPHREGIHKLKMHDYNALHSFENTIMCCGETYTNSANTTIDCFFDSTTASSHAIPLDECGNVLYDGIDSFRARSIPYKDSTLMGAANSSSASNLSVYNKLTRLSESDKGTGVSNSIWLQRVREHHPRTVHTSLRGSSTLYERLIDMNRANRSSRHVFYTPYWVETKSLRTRWGVEVVPGATPIYVNNRFYVNAEETTDASRFNARTCTPKRIHEVLCEKGLLFCSWERSARLHREVRHRRAWGSVGNPRREGDVGKASLSFTPLMDLNTPKTVCFLNAEADEINGMCNLWVAESIVKLAKWRLKLGAIHCRIPTADMMSYANSKKSSAEFSSSSSPQASHKNGFTMRSQVKLVYAEDIIERKELVWLMSYSPIIYYGRVSPPNESDEGFLEWQRAVYMQVLDPPEEDYRSATLPLEVNVDSSSASPSSLSCDRSSAATKVEDGVEKEAKKGPPLSSENHTAYAEQLYRRIWKAKRRAERLRFMLSVSSRLELALFALREGYPPESRDTWAMLSFIDGEGEPKLRGRASTEPKAASITVDLIIFAGSTADAEICTKRVVLVNHAEIDWPEGSKREHLQESWLFKKV